METKTTRRFTAKKPTWILEFMHSIVDSVFGLMVLRVIPDKDWLNDYPPL